MKKEVKEVKKECEEYLKQLVKWQVNITGDINKIKI